MCDLIEGMCNFWDRAMTDSHVTVDTPILTACFASPRQGEEEWRAYDTPQLDPARVTPLDIEQCKALAEEARSRGHWEMAKLVALSVGTVLATAVLYIGLCILISAVTVAIIYIFAPSCSGCSCSQRAFSGGSCHCRFRCCRNCVCQWYPCRPICSYLHVDKRGDPADQQKLRLYAASL